MTTAWGAINCRALSSCPLASAVMKASTTCAASLAAGDALAFAPAAGALGAGTLATGTLATGTDERANADAGAMATRARKAAGRSRRTGASTGQWGRRYWAPAPPPALPPTAGGSSAARPAAKSDRWRVRPNECPAVADPSLPGESFRENRSQRAFQGPPPREPHRFLARGHGPRALPRDGAVLRRHRRRTDPVRHRRRRHRRIRHRGRQPRHRHRYQRRGLRLQRQGP